jgi:hypothetical protein
MRINNLLWVFVVAFASALVAATPALRAADPDFEAVIAGKTLELHGFAQGAFGLPEVTGPVDVEIHTGFDVRWVNVRPLSAGITAAIAADHKSVRFKMTGTTPLTVEFNDDLARVVHLFPYAPENEVPKPGSPGVRYFGPGTYEAGLIDLHDGDTLYLAPGAWVKGNVRCVNASHVTIRGHGVLDGSDVASRPGKTGNGGPGGDGTRNMVYLEHTTDVRIEGITIFNSDFEWTVFLKGTAGTRIDGLKILNPSMRYGDDGIDVASSTDVLIQNIFVRTNDDCVVVKNLLDADSHDITVRHAVLWNMPTGGNGLEVGFEMRNTRTHGIHFQDIDIIHVERGSAISIHNGDAAVVDDVTYDDIRVEDARRKLIDFAVIYAQYGADKPASPAENARRLDRGGTWDGLLTYTPEEKPERARQRGHISNVRVTNLRVVDGALPYSVIAGFDAEHGIDGVVIEGLQYLGRPIMNAADGKFTIENARGVIFR